MMYFLCLCWCFLGGLPVLVDCQNLLELLRNRSLGIIVYYCYGLTVATIFVIFVVVESIETEIIFLTHQSTIRNR